MSDEDEVQSGKLSQFFYSLAVLCALLACAALLELLVPFSLIDSIPDAMYTPGWWLEWFPLLYVCITPFAYAFLVSFRTCWSQLGVMRKSSLLKRQATRAALRSAV